MRVEGLGLTVRAEIQHQLLSSGMGKFKFHLLSEEDNVQAGKAGSLAWLEREIIVADAMSGRRKFDRQLVHLSPLECTGQSRELWPTSYSPMFEPYVFLVA